jgi:hypothetical protein
MESILEKQNQVPPAVGRLKSETTMNKDIHFPVQSSRSPNRGASRNPANRFVEKRSFQEATGKAKEFWFLRYDRFSGLRMVQERTRCVN